MSDLMNRFTSLCVNSIFYFPRVFHVCLVSNFLPSFIESLVVPCQLRIVELH